MADCAFCSIVAGDRPAFVVADDERTVAFLDQGQATDGHTLVVPRTHADDIWAISDDDVAAVMRMVKRVAHLLDERLSPDGLNIVQSNRAAGWQEIRHLHVHVVPRWAGDGLTPPWGPSHPSPDRLATVWRRLQEPPATPGSGTANEWPR